MNELSRYSNEELENMIEFYHYEPNNKQAQELAERAKELLILREIFSLKSIS